MASATTRATFTFHLSTSSPLPHPSPPKPKTHLQFPSKPLSISSLNLVPKSIDVFKEDKRTSEHPEKFDKRRLEKFAVLNTGMYECRSCGYQYEEAAGDPSYPIPAGLPFGQLPEDWRCPTCGAAKSFFQSKSQFGLGGNTLTSAQKAVLIYGELLLGFLFFLSGYFLN
ncbi:hypothetical protein NMG60_11024805 [Bertholletia excelsa]